MSGTVRTETALIRPFGGIEQADLALDQVMLRVNAADHSPGPVVLPEETLATAGLELLLPSPAIVHEQLDKTQVPVEDCGLVILATAISHRATKVLANYRLRTAEWATEHRVTRSEAPLILDDRYGFQLTVAIVLLNDLQPRPPRPHLAGTWLARRDFRVTPEVDETSFSPEELSPAMREHLELPEGVLRFVQVNDPLAEESLTDAVHVYLDPEVLNLLFASPDDSSALQVQTELAIQATEAVADAIVQGLSTDGATPTADALSEYPSASQFMDNLASTISVSVDECIRLAIEDRSRLRALLESSFGMSALTSTALKER